MERLGTPVAPVGIMGDALGVRVIARSVLKDVVPILIQIFEWGLPLLERWVAAVVALKTLYPLGPSPTLDHLVAHFAGKAGEA